MPRVRSPQSTRHQIPALSAQGLTTRQIAKKLGKSHHWVVRVLQEEAPVKARAQVADWSRRSVKGGYVFTDAVSGAQHKIRGNSGLASVLDLMVGLNEGRYKFRKCTSCVDTIISTHFGHRMCYYCRKGDVPDPFNRSERRLGQTPASGGSERVSGGVG